MTTTRQPRPGSRGAEILELNAQGHTVREIAEQLNTGANGIRSQIKRYGHTPNPAHAGRQIEAPTESEAARPTADENATALWHYLDHRRQALQHEVHYWKARAQGTMLTAADGTEEQPLPMTQP